MTIDELKTEIMNLDDQELRKLFGNLPIAMNWIGTNPEWGDWELLSISGDAIATCRYEAAGSYARVYEYESQTTQGDMDDAVAMLRTKGWRFLRED